MPGPVLPGRVPQHAPVQARSSSRCPPPRRSPGHCLAAPPGGQEAPEQQQQQQATAGPSTSQKGTPPSQATAGQGQQEDLRRHREQVGGLKLEKVERLGEEAWAGVATVDRSKDFDLGRLGVLVCGDVAVLLLFAAIGKLSHGRPVDLLSCAETAQPFLIAWIGASIPLGEYSAEIQTAPPRASFVSAFQTWAVAVPAAILLRSIERNALPSKSFVLVTLASTFVLLLGWRALYATATQRLVAEDTRKAGQWRSDRRGNPLEFLQLLASLTKRW